MIWTIIFLYSKSASLFFARALENLMLTTIQQIWIKKFSEKIFHLCQIQHKKEYYEEISLEILVCLEIRHIKI